MRTKYGLHVAVTLLAAIVLFPAAAPAETQYVAVDSTGAAVPLGTQVPARYLQSASPTSVVKGGTLTFNVTYLDVEDETGVGFDDPVDGPVRRAALEAVLAYIDDVLNESTGAVIDVEMRLSQFDGEEFLAAVGTFFPVVNDFTEGVAQEHIQDGFDPNDMVPDFFGTVDFGWNFHDNHNEDPEVDEFDLFSILLHEFTHGLGWMSLSNDEGISRISETNPGSYSIWDRFMKVEDGSDLEPIWSGSSDPPTLLLQPVSVFTSNMLRYAVTSGPFDPLDPPPRVYAPDPFENGNSLHHFVTGEVDSVMEHAIAPGEKMRQYRDIDVAVLRELGYFNASNPTDSSNLFVDFTSATNGIGTSVDPYDNLGDAVDYAKSGAMINIAAGVSVETFSDAARLSKPVTLRNTGSEPVRIGATAKSGGRFGGFVSVSPERRP